MGIDNLRQKYADLKAEADRLAGGLLDIPRRAMILYSLYHDSGGNHPFPQVAAHGALWAYSYFEIGGRLGRLIGTRYFYNPTEQGYRLGLLGSFAEEFRRINRSVCVDAYTNYYFTRDFGREPGAEEVVPPALLDVLNRVHAARAAGRALSAQERKKTYEESFLFEQEVTVASGVMQAVGRFDCPFMQFLLLRPFVRMAYFPPMRMLIFRNFADKQERIDKGLRAYEYAEKMGWDHVRESMRRYGRLPRQFFRSPGDYCAALLAGASAGTGSAV